MNGVCGKNKARQLELGNINQQKLQRALGPVADCTGDCVPFNIFGGAGTITQAMIDYVTFDQRDRSGQRIRDGSANLSGALFDLPAGPLGVAIGYEHRDQKGSFTPDPVVSAASDPISRRCPPPAASTPTRSTASFRCR